MVKHNNQIPNIHFHKKYCESSRGPLKVKLRLDQAARKKARRVKRAARAAGLAPRPSRTLKPLVRCPTQRYSSKTRLGKGFTLEELKRAELHPKTAQRLGISVDHRRRNRCEESLELNAKRLEQYKSKLVVLKKKGDVVPSGALVTASRVVLPVAGQQPDGGVVLVDAVDSNLSAYTDMRVAKQETKVAGYRIAVENRKKKE